MLAPPGKKPDTETAVACRWAGAEMNGYQSRQASGQICRSSYAESALNKIAIVQERRTDIAGYRMACACTRLKPVAHEQTTELVGFVGDTDKLPISHDEIFFG